MGRAATDRALERLKTGLQELHEVQTQSPALGLEVLCVTVQTKSQIARKQHCRKESKCPSGQQVEHESAGYPCCKEGQLCAGLY